MSERRRAGVLLHVSALPGPGGNGDLGHHAYRFVDWLAEAGFTIWQMLPLGPTHDDLSPYQGLSVHAGEPCYIDLHTLVELGWLTPEEIQPPETGDDPVALRAWRRSCLGRARQRLRDRNDATTEAQIAAFRQAHGHWLEDYALYAALREEHDLLPWWQWPTAERDREPAALEAAATRLADRIDQQVFEQYLFFTQWQALRHYAAERGVRFFGDIPIFVAHDSADTWARRACFRLDSEGQAAVVAGVPPDYFSAEGQRWGNPLYDWQQLQADGFGWWLERLATQLALFDFVRIDHFRGLSACWTIPAEAPTARDGYWEATPGDALLEAVQERFGRVPLVAEDLGVITEDVERLRDRFALPGMKVLHFAFDSDAANPYLPHHHHRHSVVYTGTHDNNTTVGWYAGLAPETVERVHAYLGYPTEPMPWPLTRAALASVASVAVIPLQDLLELDGEHRMNVPGTTEGNWRWRFAWEWLPDSLAGQLYDLNRLYGRL
nr:4-alpha-glucanotransferase [Halorhodospira halophila]